MTGVSLGMREYLLVMAQVVEGIEERHQCKYVSTGGVSAYNPKSCIDPLSWIDS
jgi:hypothetical protein